MDHDTVGISNLHRQVLHSTDRVGMNKAASASLAIHKCALLYHDGPARADN